CFFRRVEGDDARALPADDGPGGAADVIFGKVYDVVLERKAGRGTTNPDGKSYVRSLLDKGVPKISEKIREEAEELCRALASESPERVASEAADLVFHALVGLAARDLHLRDVGRVLAGRFGVSGIDEKAARGTDEGG